MIVWGGMGSRQQRFGVFGDGARYDPSTDTWRPLPAAGAPSPRDGHTAVWTGKEMLIWGGEGRDAQGRPTYPSDGARYDPAADRWTPIRQAGEPSPRNAASSVWTGREMLVWGGTTTSGMRNDGGRYDPAADTWRPLASIGAPAPRVQFAGTWTGDELLVWGGGDRGAVLPDGGRYNPASNSWLPFPPAPIARDVTNGVWTGREMLIWGGTGWPDPSEPEGHAGAAFDPHTGRWRLLAPSVGAPPARSFGSVVWTGRSMLVWGGDLAVPREIVGDAGGYLGWRYDVAADVWWALGTSRQTDQGVLQARRDHTAVWSGTEMLVWGGTAPGGFRYRPPSGT
jgi:hypothetical protein